MEQSVWLFTLFRIETTNSHMSVNICFFIKWVCATFEVKMFCFKGIKQIRDCLYTHSLSLSLSVVYVHAHTEGTIYILQPLLPFPLKNIYFGGCVCVCVLFCCYKVAVNNILLHISWQTFASLSVKEILNSTT